MRNIDAINHVQGKSIYVDDILLNEDSLHAAVFYSPVAHGIISNIDYTLAENLSGVVKIFKADDIPGENQIGAIIKDEPLLAEKEVHYIGQPIALIVAENEKIALQARKLIRIEIKELSVIVDARTAFNKKQFIMQPRTFRLGDVEKSFKNCEYVISGTVNSGAQEHLYIETQGAYALPVENNCLKVYSSTQGPTVVQKTIASILGISMNKIEVDVRRLGGGFGGKEDQATPVATMAAMAAYLLQKPVKLIYQRHDDLKMTGKRHPYSSDFKIGLNKDLKIIAYEVDFLQNAGAAADLSPAILERTLFHTTNSYFIPNVRSTVYSCKTNLPPNTAFRGFGAPQAIFVMEAAIYKAAETIGVKPEEIQKANLLKNGDEFPYGQIAENVETQNVWKQFEKEFNIENIKTGIAEYNANNEHSKKAMALIPVCFGISFTNTSMNQARALVHIYQDGSVGVSTGAIEMGQGVNTKLLQVAANIFSIDKSRIKLETTNTTRVANTSPTAASSGADLNGKALEVACRKLLKRLKKSAAEILNTDKKEISLQNEEVFIGNRASGLKWEELVWQSHLKRKKLSEKGHYATPHIHFDKNTEKGHPFAYHVYGLASIVAKLNVVDGSYEFEQVNIVHDFGKSMNLLIDKGQIEGGLLQGMGWMTMEEIQLDKKGRLLANALSTYKVPDIYAAPKEVNIKTLLTENNNQAILKSKAVGEPPFIYGIGAYFALLNAIKAFNPDFEAKFDAPLTHEKVLMSLYG